MVDVGCSFERMQSVVEVRQAFLGKRSCGYLPVVIYGLRLGPKALAQAWPEGAC
jgi:hypothetical protein